MFLLTELNVHRVIITAILLAAKFFDDAYYNNAYYAKVGGVHTSEINGLESDFLFRINFSLYVTSDEFDKYRSGLLAHLATTPTLVPQVSLSEQHLYHQPTCQLQPYQPNQYASSSQQVVAAAAAAAAAISAQVAIQQAFDHQSNAAIFRGDVRNGLLDEYVHAASQITPSPPACARESNHQLMSAMLHPNATSSTDEMIAAANNNLILQSLEFIQHSMDNAGAGSNNNLTYPIMQRTHSMPVKIGCGASAQLHDHCFNTFNHSSATPYSSNLPQSCPIDSFHMGNPYTNIPMEEQYLRLLVESTQHSQQEQFHHQQQIHRQHPLIGSVLSSNGTSGAYNNVIALQNEARRIAVAQGQMLAAAGVSGPGL
jgi:Cyclin